MTLRSVVKFASVAIGGCSLFLAQSACSRDPIEAINLANKGDQQVKVNVEGAISQYEQATNLDPTNHRILKKLAVAYEKKEDWDKMASTLARAVQVAPDHADYWFKRGYALIKQAEAGNPDAYEQAKEPLTKCIEKDPNFAECYHFLGQAHLWTDDIQNALANYTKAIEHNPSKGYFYPPVGETYVTLKFYEQAEAILKEGTRLVQSSERNNPSLYGMNILLFQCAQARNDKPAMAAAMESAHDVAGDTHPEVAFNLGSTYAVMDPPRTEKAVRLLSSFSKRACRGANAKKFRDQCETSQALIQKLGGKVN